MTERKPKKKKKADPEELPQLTKDETAVAKYLRFNMQTKKSTLYGDQLDYFMGSTAVDLLLESRWAKGDISSVVITDRDSAVDFMNKLLLSDKIRHVHLIRTEKKVKSSKDGKDTAKKKKKLEEKEKVDETAGTPKKSKDGKEPRKVKKKVKITLELHEHQYFADEEEEAYGWFYDPISAKTFALGILLVLAVVVICLFPLWPENVREYSWYVSVAGAIFVGAILVLAVLRYIVFAIVWICTMGQLDFWMLPNLTAECGFFESFVPAYEYEWKGKKEEEEDQETTSDNKDESLEKINDTTEKVEDNSEKMVQASEHKLLGGNEENIPNDEQSLENVNADEGKEKGSGNDGESTSDGSQQGDWVRVQKDDLDEVPVAAEC